MANYYALISHHESDRNGFYINMQLARRELSIGWGRINPIGLTADQIKAGIKNSYPEWVGTPNPWNGEQSLSLFCSLSIGDIVFVRGNARVVDVAIITGNVFYDSGNGHDEGGDNFCTKVAFRPIFEDRLAGVPVNKIPKHIFADGGSRLAMRKIDAWDAIILFKKILANPQN